MIKADDLNGLANDIQAVANHLKTGKDADKQDVLNGLAGKLETSVAALRSAAADMAVQPAAAPAPASPKA